MTCVKPVPSPLDRTSDETAVLGKARLELRIEALLRKLGVDRRDRQIRLAYPMAPPRYR